VAIKIQRSAPHYFDAAYDEVEVLQKISKLAKDPAWIESLKEYHKDPIKGHQTKTDFTKDDCHVV
jgi:serine/threonine-protein kinase SRPK3